MKLELQWTELIRQESYIAGEWLRAQGPRQIEVINPANGTKIGVVPSCTAEDAKRAICAAESCQKAWRRETAKHRSEILKRWAALMQEHADDLAKIITLEQGKPLKEAKGEVAYSTSYVEWFAEEAKRAYGDIIPTHRKDARLLVLKEAIGVVATITPWNFPSSMLARKVAPALAAGCGVVSKPSELTPFSALALAFLAEKAGVPKGLWNVLNGDPSTIGMELTSNATVKKVSFTGSTRVGRLLMQQCAPTLKKLSLELGGNAPFIVFESADVESAVKAALHGKFRNNGQTCICVNRFLVHEKVYKRFSELLQQAIQSLRVGDGSDNEVDLGPLINQTAVSKVQLQIDDALRLGGKLCIGGKRHTLGGTYFEPTLIEEANSNMLVAREETFGPLACLFRFSNEEEAIALANSSEFGLAGYFFSNDLGQIWRVAEALEVGMVGINDTAISSENIPFGGVKQSGFGREGSKYGLDEYMVTKYLCMGGV